MKLLAKNVERSIVEVKPLEFLEIHGGLRYIVPLR